MKGARRAGLTQLQSAVLLVLRAYEEARLTLDRDQRRVLREIIGARLAKDVVAEELDIDLDDLQNAA